MLVFCSTQIGWRRYQLVPDSLQKFLLVEIDQRMSEQRHKVICHYNEIPTCLCCPEVICDKIIDGEITLQFLYPVLRIRPSAICVIYDFGWQIKVCYKATVSVFTEIFLVLEKLQLLDLLSRSFRALLNFLPDHHNTSCLLPTICLIGGFGYFQSFCQLYPFAFMGKTVLYAIIETAGYDVV